ncbi:site-specific integrase [Pelosinus sp. IPA-1]|uniref:tyrosine-type recombinase/integrase n=1 Tax=Pelosinus sp. IPA-1 TaxID=3029569 RepID=UPI00243628F4|nr:site-specific integrase [Pelosinus sp. IPA-1]GMB02046.1 hypothetical protein PIPA1_48460 [Pelosinus sp. IPA-1]
MPSKIKKRGENSYLLTVTAGYDGQGKQICHTKTITANSPTEAKRFYHEFATEVQRGNVTLTGKLKIKDFAERWFKEYCQKNLAPKTQQTYKLYIDKRIIPALGHIDIAKLKPLQVLAFINNLQEDGLRLDGKAGTLSSEAVTYCYRVLSSMLRDAVQWQIIPNSPCDRVKPPTLKKTKTDVYNEEQTYKMLECLEVEEIKHRTIILLALASGLRIGELCGLEWSDIDLNEGHLTVNRASQSLSGFGTFDKSPKNNSSNRTVTLPTSIISLLKQYKAWQNAECLRLGDKWNKTDRLFTQWNGNKICTTSPSQWFSKFLKRHGLPHITFHSLRHTSATLLIASGASLKSVSSRLGHADIRTTGNIYSHALQSVDTQLADSMNTFLTKQEPNISAQKKQAK